MKALEVKDYKLFSLVFLEYTGLISTSFLSSCLSLDDCALTPVFAPLAQDTIYEEHLVMLRGSTSEFVAELFSEKHSAKGSLDIRKATVSSQFKSSLS